MAEQSEVVGYNAQEYFKQAAELLSKAIDARNADNLGKEKAKFEENETNRAKAAGVNATWPAYVCYTYKLEMQIDGFGYPKTVETREPIFNAPTPKSILTDKLNPADGGFSHAVFSADGQSYRMMYATPFGWQTTGWMPVPK